MASNAINALGVTLSRSDGAATPAFAPVAEVTDFNGPGGQATIIDNSHLGSVFVEKMLGLRDEGQVTLTCNLVPNDEVQKGMRADRKAGTLRDFKLTLTDDEATELTFSAYVMGFPISGSVNDKVTVEITLEVSGEVTWSNDAAA